MDISPLASYLIPALVLGFLGWRFMGFRRVRGALPGLLGAGAVIVDVRSPGEFAGGAAPGSVNIPLRELASRAGELDPSKPVVLCCASGTRSAMAAAILKRAGFSLVYDAGPWGNTLVR